MRAGRWPALQVVQLAAWYMIATTCCSQLPNALAYQANSARILNDYTSDGWPLRSSVFYDPFSIGSAPFYKPGSGDNLYGWQARDIIIRDFQLISDLFGEGTTVMLPLASMGSTGDDMKLTKTLCKTARYLGLKLAPQLSIRVLVDASGGLLKFSSNPGILQTMIQNVRLHLLQCSSYFRAFGAFHHACMHARVCSRILGLSSQYEQSYLY